MRQGGVGLREEDGGGLGEQGERTESLADDVVCGWQALAAGGEAAGEQGEAQQAARLGGILQRRLHAHPAAPTALAHYSGVINDSIGALALLRAAQALQTLAHSRLECQFYLEFSWADRITRVAPVEAACSLESVHHRIAQPALHPSQRTSLTPAAEEWPAAAERRSLDVTAAQHPPRQGGGSAAAAAAAAPRWQTPATCMMSSATT